MQAFKQAMNESGGRSQTIILQLNGREFARAVYKANNEETQRVGLKLASARAKKAASSMFNAVLRGTL